MRLAVVSLALVIVVAAADRVLLGKPAPGLTDTKDRTVIIFQPLDNETQQQLVRINMKVRILADAELKKDYGVLQDDRAAVLVDERGILRRVVRRREGAPEFSQTLLREMNAWEDGRSIYEVQCARCHGEDGNGTNYPNIKTLSGIGNRLTEPQIAEATGQVGTVDLTVLGDRVKSLAAFVAGL